MQTIKRIINQHGGLEALPLRFVLKPGSFLLIEEGSRGPGGRRVVRLSCHIRQQGRLHFSQVLLEVTDLGLLPFYLRSSTGAILRAYRFDRRRRIRQVRRDIRARIVRETNAWDAELGEYLDQYAMLGR